MGVGAGVAAAAVGAVGSVAGSAISAGASKSAASKQQDAANLATIAQEKQAAQTRADLNPFQRLGTDTIGQITPNIGYYGQIGGLSPNNTYASTLDQAAAENPTVYPNVGTLPNIDAVSQATPNQTTFTGRGFSQAELEATPGYKFARDQGLQAVQNSAAARGLGVSGAALKGAASYATGLADQTYGAQFTRALQQQGQDFGQQKDIFGARQQTFGNQQTVFADQNQANQLAFTNQQQRFTNLVGLNAANQGNVTNSVNRLQGLASLGENAAAQTGSNSLQSTNAAGQFLTGGANAAGAGQIASGNALAGGFNGITNAANQYANYNKLYGGGSEYGNGTGGGYSNSDLARVNGGDFSSSDQASALAYNKLYGSGA